MILEGWYKQEGKIFRPYIYGFILSENKWHCFPFLIDTGADETFLPYESISKLNINTSRIEVRDDVGGIGGQGVPYFRYETQLKFVTGDEALIFKGLVNVFLDPHAADTALLGRDVLDQFIVIFDRFKSNIIFLEKIHIYSYT